LSVGSSALGVERAGGAGRAVFLSYASQDAEAAKRIADALRAAGVEVWFDAEGGLEHGDAWDAKIRRQIKECVLFIPLISANTQAREEGYFRIEWELAAQRALGIATGVAFILPVLIDGTKEAGALVPDRFRTVQWTKLPGGVVPPEVLQRFLKLWSHRTGALKGVAAEGGASLDGAHGRAQGAPRQQAPFRHWWMIFPVLGTVMGLLFAAVPLWKALNRPARHDPARAEGPVAVPTKPVEPHAVKTVTPATRDWPRNPELKKAMNLIEGLAAIPDDLALAEEIAKGVLDRSPTDIEAVTVMARVQAHFLRRGFDRSDERAALAKRYAERALQLAPDEPEAMYALATYHFSRATGETARTEQLLRRAIELDPTNPRPGRLLADLYNVTNRPAEAIAQGQDNIRRFPNDVLSHYDLARNYKDQGRYDEFDRELDATLSLAPLPNAIVWKARLQFGLRNDFAGMKAWLDRVPARVRGTERAVFSYFLYAGLGGDPETGLAALRDFPEKWFTDFEYAGPTALLNASLLELQGKTELARRQYEVAQGEILRMRQTDPGRIGLSQVEFWTLLGLGRIEEAKASYRRVVEGTRRPYAQEMVNGWWFTVIPGSLLIGDRTTALALLRESIGLRPESRAAFRLRFQIDPRMAPFRDDPEIKALLADPGSVSAVSAPKIDSKSVAVLAFANLSSDKEQEYFSDGISEELLNVLAKVPGLKVSARTSAFFFKGKEVPIPEIARQLGVAYVVEGSVRKAGDKVRITAQLIKAADGFHVWSDTFTRDLKDIFAVQDEIAGLIAKNLELKMGMSADGRASTSPAVYELLLQARALAQRENNESGRQAVALYRRVLEADPEQAAAWAELARVNVQLGRFGGSPISEAMREARAAAQRALEIDPEQAIAWLALGWVQRTADWDWRGARRSFERARQLSPGRASIMSDTAVLYFNLGRVTEAVALAREAVALDPLNARAQASLGFILNINGDWELALAPLAKAAALAPAIEEVRSHQARALAALGRVDEAKVAAEQEPNEAYRLVARSYIPGPQADQALAEFVAKYGGEMPGYVALLYGIRGEAEPSFSWMDRAVTKRDAAVAWIKSNVNMRSLHADPRWPALLHKLGLADEQLR
jgi:TolB-like protein/cytochrome c-type biogenesis protein CcmH/NrfG